MILGTRYLSVFLLNLVTTDLGILVESMYVHTYIVWILFCLTRISTPSIRGRGKRLETFRILLSSQRSLLQNASFAMVAATEQNASKQHTHACFSIATKGFSPLSIWHAATSTWSVVLWLATDQAEVASHARCYWVLVPIDAWFCVTLLTVSGVEMHPFSSINVNLPCLAKECGSWMFHLLPDHFLGQSHSTSSLEGLKQILSMSLKDLKARHRKSGSWLLSGPGLVCRHATPWTGRCCVTWQSGQLVFDNLLAWSLL